MLNHAAMRLFTLFASVIFCAGCTGDLIEIGPNATHDMAGSSGPPDMAQGGGGEMGPTTVHFIPDVQADIDSKGCTNSGCHGGGTNPPVLKMMPTTQTDKDSNYMNFKSNCNLTAPDQSNVLKTMLPGGGHGGGQQFASTGDAIYQRWLGWITGGAPE